MISISDSISCVISITSLVCCSGTIWKKQQPQQGYYTITAAHQGAFFIETTPVTINGPFTVKLQAVACLG